MSCAHGKVWGNDCFQMEIIMKSIFEFYIKYEALPLILTAVAFLIFSIFYAALVDNERKNRFMVLALAGWLVLILPQILITVVVSEVKSEILLYELELKNEACEEMISVDRTDFKQKKCLALSKRGEPNDGYYEVRINEIILKIDSCEVLFIRQRNVDEYSHELSEVLSRKF